MKIFRPVLCGVKHCGKSTLGRHLAARFCVHFVDSDSELEKKYTESTGERKTVREIFTTVGETKFRELEAATLRDLADDHSPRVLALGGGAVSNPFVDSSLLAGLGMLIFIDTDDDTAFRRISRRGLPPFLSGAPDPARALKEINTRRRVDFMRCAALVFTPDPDAAAARNVERLALKLQEIDL